jgi:hypothetical protein
MPKKALPESQRLALLYLLEHEDPALFDDIAKAIHDERRMARSAMQALVHKGLAEPVKFKGMVHDLDGKLHLSRQVAFRATPKARLARDENVISREEKPMPAIKAPRHRSEANRRAAVETALLEFVDAIEVTGGVMRDPLAPERFVPVADEDWIDLGEVYLSACLALGKKPKVNR